MIRVLIADDEALLRAGVRMILDTADDIEVVAEAADGPAAAHACRGGDVDVALLDVRMPGGDGLSAAARIHRTAPHTRVLVLTTFHDEAAVTTALRSGAAGFLLEDTGPNELIAAVRAAARGEPALAPQVTRTLIAQHLDSAEPGGDAHPNARHRIGTLSPAELEVLKALAEGAANGEIAERLYMSTGTVKAHISASSPSSTARTRAGRRPRAPGRRRRLAARRQLEFAQHPRDPLVLLLQEGREPVGR